jgi:hypothetical protein
MDPAMKLQVTCSAAIIARTQRTDNQRCDGERWNSRWMSCRGHPLAVIAMQSRRSVNPRLLRRSQPALAPRNDRTGNPPGNGFPTLSVRWRVLDELASYGLAGPCRAGRVSRAGRKPVRRTSASSQASAHLVQGVHGAWCCLRRTRPCANWVVMLSSSEHSGFLVARPFHHPTCGACRSVGRPQTLTPFCLPQHSWRVVSTHNRGGIR